jgi:SAM-dependent methyltransferase
VRHASDRAVPPFPPYREPATGDVPVFLRFRPIEDEATRQRLDSLNSRALRSGWRDALAQTFGDDPALMRYVSDPTRSRFLDLLPLEADSDVLEIGPGLGQFTALIAGKVRTVSALEIVEGQARFVATRCAEEGLDNVRVACGGDDCSLPYASAGFDVVILSLVLEWCGGRNETASHQEMQMRLLSEVARVLRPGGTAYVSTKNRFALRYLLGGRDEHVHGMRFGNALPRWAMRLALRLQGRSGPQGLLHSHRRLSVMLEAAGLWPLTSYWLAPEMRFPTEFIPTEPQAIAAARRNDRLRQGETRLTDWVMRGVPARWVRHFTPGLVFVGRRG